MDLLTIPNIVEYLKKNKNFFTYDNDVFVITFGYFNAYIQVEYSDTNTIEVLQFFIRNDDDDTEVYYELVDVEEGVEGITFELFESSFSDMIEHLDNYNTGIRKLQKTLADIQNIMNEYQISLTFVEKFISDLEDPTIF